MEIRKGARVRIFVRRGVRPRAVGYCAHHLHRACLDEGEQVRLIIRVKGHPPII